MRTTSNHHLIVTNSNIKGWSASNWLPESKPIQQHVLASLSATKSMDCTSLKGLLEAQQKLKQVQKKLILIAPSPAVRTLLYFTQISELVPIFPRIQDALNYLQS